MDTFNIACWLQISPEDIRWEGEDPSILHRGGHSGQGRGANKLFNHGGGTYGAGRGRGHPRFHPRKELITPQNGIGNRVPDEIELLNTETLVKEVDIDMPKQPHWEPGKDKEILEFLIPIML